MFNRVSGGEVVWTREFAVESADRWYEHEAGEIPVYLPEIAGFDGETVKKLLPVGYGLEIAVRKLPTKTE